MKNKKDSNWFFRTLFILFLIFISLYIAMESGYYESKVAKKTAITNENIKRFEQDVKDGNAIDVNDYVYDDFIDYSNHTTDAIIFVSNGVEKFMSKGINEIFQFIKALVS